MNPPASAPPTRRLRRRKPLNLPLIKSLIVMIVGSFTALGSALTGIGAQVAFAPMLTWMLGFNTEKAKATALRYAVFVSLAACVGIAIRGVLTGLNAVQIAGYVGAAELLCLGATIGAVISLPMAPGPTQISRRRLMQSLGVILTLFVVIQASHLSRLTANSLHYAHWNAWWALLGMGFIVGIFTQATGLAGGVIMVPALYFLGGYNAYETVSLSLLVIAHVSLLPAWSYHKKRLDDTTFGNYAALGGTLGGLLGGLLLMNFQEKFILMFFGVVAMFLSARELYRLSMETLPVEEPPTV
jgi:uncharacterized membrane protein YfcA